MKCLCGAETGIQPAAMQ